MKRGIPAVGGWDPPPRPRHGVVRLFDDQALRSSLVPLAEHASSSLPIQALMLATAAGIGAAHALGAGHGKVLIGAYLAGSRGRPCEALTLGGLVAMHSASVIVMGVVLSSTAR